MSSTTIDGTAVKEVQKLAERAARAESPIVKDGNGIEYAQAPLTRLDAQAPPKLPEPEKLTVQTLQGVVDFVKANRDEIMLDTCSLFVAPTVVELIGPLHGHHQQRFSYLRATAPNRFASANLNFGFGRFMPQVEMVIAMNALFDRTSDLDAAVALISKITYEGSVTEEAGGHTQGVQTKRSLTLNAGSENLPNPIVLQPFRTFAEIEQPPSPFVLRVQGGEGRPIHVALFEADGGAWQLEAIASIKAWLTTELPGTPVAIVG